MPASNARTCSGSAWLQELLEAVRSLLGDDLPFYTDCLTGAFAAVEPVFLKARYQEFFWHCAGTVPGWIGAVVLANAQAESDGSAKLLALWQGVTYNRDVEAEILSHARDESRHSHLFIKLTRAAFPRIPEADLRAHQAGLTRIGRTQRAKCGPPIPEWSLIDHLVQMNIGEIRTRLHMELLAPAIHTVTPSARKNKVGEILHGLGYDEVRHIAYTAQHVEAWCRDGALADIRRLYHQRLHDFDALTVEQTEGAVRRHGRGMFPDLLDF